MPQENQQHAMSDQIKTHIKAPFFRPDIQAFKPHEEPRRMEPCEKDDPDAYLFRVDYGGGCHYDFKRLFEAESATSLMAHAYKAGYNQRCNEAQQFQDRRMYL